MPPNPIQVSGTGVDLSTRVQVTTTVGASPALAAETIIGTLTLANFSLLSVTTGIELSGWAAFTVGTSGTAVTLRIRQTNVSGTVIATTGALTGGVSAGNLLAQDVEGFDSGAGVAVYVLTLQVTAGAAASTVSALKLRALVI